MAVEFSLVFTDQVQVLPKATLGDGTEVTDYATRTLMEVKGVSGDYGAARSDWVSLADPADMTAADFVPWSTFEASRPAALQPLMDDFFSSVSGNVVISIERQFNVAVIEDVPAWAGTE